MTSSSLSRAVGAGSGRWERVFQRVPQLICLVLLFLYSGFFIYRAVAALGYPYPMGYGEGAVFYESGQLFRGGFNPARLYLPNSEPPYQAGIYNPLFYYLQALVMLISSPTGIWGGRLISLLACIWLGWLVFNASRWQELVEGRRSGFSVSLGAVITPFATAAVYTWGVYAKSDMLMVAFSLAAVYVVARTDANRMVRNKNFNYVLAGTLCALAFLTKQSAIAAPLTIVLWFLIGRRWRDLWYFVVAAVVPVVVVGGIMQLATNGQFFYHVFRYNTQGYDFSFLWAGLNYFVGGHYILLLIALWWTLRPFMYRYDRVDIWRIYFLIALVVTLSVGKVGSDFNYYLEAIFLTSMLAWWQIGRWLMQKPGWRIPFGNFKFALPLVPVVYALLAVQLFQLHHIPVIADSAETPSPAISSQGTRVAELLRQQAAIGPILAEDSGWQAALGLITEYDDPFVFGQLAKDGIWRNDQLIERLSKGYYKTVMYRIDYAGTPEELDELVQAGKAVPFTARFDPQVLAIIQNPQLFTPFKRIGNYLFLVWQAGS